MHEKNNNLQVWWTTFFLGITGATILGAAIWPNRWLEITQFHDGILAHATVIAHDKSWTIFLWALVPLILAIISWIAFTPGPNRNVLDFIQRIHNIENKLRLIRINAYSAGINDELYDALEVVIDDIRATNQIDNDTLAVIDLKQY